MFLTSRFGRELIHKAIFDGLFMIFEGKTEINMLQLKQKEISPGA